MPAIAITRIRILKNTRLNQTVRLLPLAALFASPLLQAAEPTPPAATSVPAEQATPSAAATMAMPDNVPLADYYSDSPRDARGNGGIAIVAVPEGIAADKLRYHGQPVWVGHLPGKPGLQAVVGLGLADTGTQTLTLDDDKTPVATLTVGAIDYPEQHITLAPNQSQYVNPDPEQLARFAREAAEQKAAYRVFTTAKGTANWPTFRWPLVSHLSSQFGLKRFFNGEPRQPHLGVDIAGQFGLIGRAPADGVVALTGDFFFNGRTVIIDHGQGLYSMLCHFQKILVQPGQVLHAGDPVGEVGMTGRATAPHLHWTVSLNDERIDPHWLFPGGSGQDSAAQ